MADPARFDSFLRAHFDESRIYRLDRRQPFSVRDQMIRARLIVDRLSQAGWLRSSLLIVGAGAAGVATARHAFDRGFSVTILEKSGSILERFASCTGRLIDPTQYDWPCDHWKDGYCRNSPLRYSASLATALVIVWKSEMERIVATGRVRLRTGVTDLVLDPDTERNLRAEWFGAEPGLGEFDAVIFCTGFGEEDCAVGTYRGFRFWETDPFEEADIGISEIPMKVLVSGGGDGALQDFIRITTGFQSARELFEYVIPPEVERNVRLRAHSLEDNAQRNHLWSSPASDHFVNSWLDRGYGSIIREMSTQANSWQKVIGLLDRIVRSRNDDGREIHLVHPCGHLSTCYGLNRFLAQLIMLRLTEYDSTRFREFTNQKITKITGVNHTCALEPKECHGEEHLVSFEEAPCRIARSAARAIQPRKYHAVVVRHGLLNKTEPIRQLLPYYVIG